MRVPRRWGDVDIPAIACIEFRQRRARACTRMHQRAKSSAFESVVIRNGILFRSRVHRGTSIGGLPRASPSDRATWGWGTTWGGGIKGWGKVTRSGLLGTPDLGTSTSNAISRRRLYEPRGAKSFWAAASSRSVRHVALKIFKPGRRARIRRRAPVATRRQ